MSTEPAHLPPRPGCWRGIRGGAACAGASEPYGTRRRHEADAQRARLARWRSARRRTRPPQRPAPPANARVARREDPGPSTSRAFTARSAEVQTSISSRGCKATGPLTPARTSRHAAQRPGQRGRRVSRRGPRPARTFTALEQSSLCEGTVMSARADSSPPLSCGIGPVWRSCVARRVRVANVTRTLAPTAWRGYRGRPVMAEVVEGSGGTPLSELPAPPPEPEIPGGRGLSSRSSAFAAQLEAGAASGRPGMADRDAISSRRSGESHRRGLLRFVRDRGWARRADGRCDR